MLLWQDGTKTLSFSVSKIWQQNHHKMKTKKLILKENNKRIQRPCQPKDQHQLLANRSQLLYPSLTPTTIQPETSH